MDIIRRNIPNTVTCMNMAAGVTAIILASKGQEQLGALAAWQWAMICIGIAAVADFCDGLTARLLKAYSELGKELDSLCDAVSFGVAPAMLLYQCLSATASQPWIAWGAVLIPVAGALRLARFNIDTRQATDFIGMPIPANAIFWIGFVAWQYSNVVITSWWALALIIVVMSWMMLSPWRMVSLKFKSLGWKGNERRWLLIAAAVVCVVCLGVPGLMWPMLIYIAMGAKP